MVAFEVRTNRKVYGCFASQQHAVNVQKKLFNKYGIGTWVVPKNVELAKFLVLKDAYRPLQKVK